MPTICHSCGQSLKRESKVPCFDCKKPFAAHVLEKGIWGRCPKCSEIKQAHMDGLYGSDNKRTPELAGEWGRNAAMQAKDNPDVIQPFNKDGTFSNKFVKTHGAKRLAKEMGMSEREIVTEAERYS